MAEHLVELVRVEIDVLNAGFALAIKGDAYDLFLLAAQISLTELVDLVLDLCFIVNCVVLSLAGMHFEHRSRLSLRFCILR